MAESPQFIEGIEDVVKIGCDSCSQWFRGQPESKPLMPSIRRPEYSNVTLANDCNYEGTLLMQFQLEAPAYHHKEPPGGANNLDWLFFARHHGLPTRLLDWSKNILVATYFAVSEKPDCNGELWRIDPYKLNQLRNMPGLASPHDSIVDLVVQQAFIQTNKNRGWFKPSTPIAVLPYLDYPRLVVQSSVSTLHPEAENVDDDWVEQLVNHDASACYIIPKEKKSEIRKALYSLGISRRFLFPDLDSLCVDLLDSHSGMVKVNL